MIVVTAVVAVAATAACFSLCVRGWVAGMIPESLGQLTHLTRLDLGFSELAGK